MQNRRPAVFVSSTCYDLAQVRDDLRLFIEGFGYDPILSERNCFPVDPDLGTVENCLKVVEGRADLFVLIVGNRHGSDDGRGKSITNAELLTARSKGIPIYAFVRHDILHILPLWRKNTSADFSGVVDNPNLLRFVSELHDARDTWVFSFASAQQIFDALRSQWAYLFMDALALRTRARRSGAIAMKYRDQHGPVLRILIEREPGWEWTLFAEAVKQHIAALADLKRDWRHGIAFGPARQLTGQQLSTWLRQKNAEALRMARNLERILAAAMESVGPPGSPGDADSILHAARSYAGAYQSILEWKLDFLRAAVPEPFEGLREIASRMLDKMVSEVEEYTENVIKTLPEAAAAARAGQCRSINLTLTPSGPDHVEYEGAQRRALFLLKPVGFGVREVRSPPTEEPLEWLVAV